MIFIFIILTLIIAVTETILSGKWNKNYFLHGIPIYSKELKISNAKKAAADIDSFINHLDSVPGFSKYTGKTLGENLFAYRKKMITVSLVRNDFDNISGIVLIDPENRILKIKGHTGYTFIAAMLYFFVFFVTSAEGSVAATSISAGLIILIIGLIFYAVSRRKYNRLYNKISKLI